MMDFNKDFIEKIVLLLITGTLTGFLIPFILKRIDEQKAKEQKEREAMLARQSKIIEAQSELFKILSKLLWDWRYLIMKVSYYGGQKTDDRFKDAWNKYDTDIWNILNQIRYQASLSRSLISEAVYVQLITFYYEIVNFDKQLQHIINEKDNIKKVLQLADLNVLIFNEATSKVDALIDNIAKDVNLSVNIKK